MKVALLQSAAPLAKEYIRAM